MKVIFKVFSFLTFVSIAASQDLKQEFDALMSKYKGPFGKNHLVDYVGFQGAFRNEEANAIKEKYGVYLGNGYATNYRELVALHVYSDTNPETYAFKSTLKEKDNLMALANVDPNDMQASAPIKQALDTATNMIRNSVLEYYYRNQFPDSGLAKSFGVRGIAGFEYEVVYVKEFFNFYFKALEFGASEQDKEYRYLPAYLLVEVSPLADASNLSRARGLVDGYGHGDKALYRLRNLIHNQPSPAVIDEIDRYLESNGGPDSLRSARAALAEYFTVNSSKIISQAKELKLTELQRVAETMKAAKNEDLQTRSQALVDLASHAVSLKSLFMTNGGVNVKDKLKVLGLLSTLGQYLGKEAQLEAEILHKNGQLRDMKSTYLAQVFLTGFYVEGLLTKKVFDYYMKKTTEATSLVAALSHAGGITKAALNTLSAAFSKELPLWEVIEPKMSGFKDDTLKSSTLSLFDAFVQKVNGTEKE